MRSACLALAALVLSIGAAAAGTTGAADPPGVVETGRCDRACLQGLVDQYLAALVAHDPERLPLRQGVKYTENGQLLRLGDGLWGTAEAIGGEKLYAADPVAGEVGFLGEVQESGRPVRVALRLKAVGKKIAEVETLVIRSTSMGGPERAAPPFTAKPVFAETLDPGQRRSREAMLAIANSYFEGLEQATGRITPFEPGCVRVEDGMVTAGDPAAPKGSMQSLTCGEQFATGFSPFITEVRGRRFPVVDQERGLVMALVSFDHAGRIKAVKLADGSTMKVPAPFDAPFSFLMAELFKIRDGKIARVEAVIYTTPYAMPSGW